MIPRDHGCGAGLGGLTRYLMHDSPTEWDPSPKSTERVLWTATLGATPTDDMKLAIRMMQSLTRQAKDLKARTGSRGGRKLRKPYSHISVAFELGNWPSQGECISIGNRMLRAMGCEDQYSAAVAHTDGTTFHFHVFTARVHPVTGIAAGLHHPGTRMAEEAERIEREQGAIIVPSRVQRREIRESIQQRVDQEMAGFMPVSTTVTARKKEMGLARKTIRRRAYAATPFPPVKRSPARAGRPPKSAAHTAEWDATFTRQRDLGIPEAVCKQEIRALSQVHKLEDRTRLHRETAPSPPITRSLLPAPIALEDTLPEPSPLPVATPAPILTPAALSPIPQPVPKPPSVPTATPARLITTSRPALEPRVLEPPPAPTISPARLVTQSRPTVREHERAIDTPVPTAMPAPAGWLPADRPAPPSLTGPAAVEVEDLLNHVNIDCSPETALQLQDELAAGTDTASRLAHAAVTKAEARGNNGPLQRLVTQDVAAAHRERTSAYMIDHYQLRRKPREDMLEVEARKRPIDPELIDSAWNGRLLEMLQRVKEQVRTICDKWLTRRPAPAPAGRTPDTRTLTPPRPPAAAPPMAGSGRHTIPLQQRRPQTPGE